MSGTDPGLFGVPAAPDEGRPNDTTPGAPPHEEDTDATLRAQELAALPVGRMPVYPVERAESAGMSAAAYRGEAHRPPTRQEHATLPDAKVLVHEDAPPASLREPDVSRTVPTDPGSARVAAPRKLLGPGVLMVLMVLVLLAALALVSVAFLRKPVASVEPARPAPSPAAEPSAPAAIPSAPVPVAAPAVSPTAPVRVTPARTSAPTRPLAAPSAVPRSTASSPPPAPARSLPFNPIE